jgi:predicted short-subunit dehydrogenase-like oxidoreductase (DUF2520 family)
MAPVPKHVTILGSGKAGTAFARALREAGVAHSKHAYRRPWPKRFDDTDLILICVRDAQIKPLGEALARIPLNPNCVAIHVSGAVGPEGLATLLPHCRGIGQLHPFVSIAAKAPSDIFKGAYFLAAGTASAKREMRWLTRQLHGHWVSGDNIDRARYHLSAALFANGSVALLSEAVRLLSETGVQPRIAVRMLTSLGQSVFANARRLGAERALTGPVRRGDVETLRRHLQILEASPERLALYRHLVAAQLSIVDELGELSTAERRRVRRVLGHG